MHEVLKENKVRREAETLWSKVSSSDSIDRLQEEKRHVRSSCRRQAVPGPNAPTGRDAEDSRHRGFAICRAHWLAPA